MNKKKGFTLIELLAVIVILAVIALITIPAVMSVVADAKNGAVKSSTYGYISAIEKSISLRDVNNQPEIAPGTYGINDFPNIVKGTKPTDGIIVVGQNGEVEQAQICMYDLRVNYTNGLAIIDQDNDCSTIGAAAEPTADVCFDFDSGTGTIIDYLYNGTTCGSEVVIPSTIGGINVTTIGNSAFYEKSLTSIELPNGIVTIETFAFTDNQIVGYLTIPNSVTTIGSYAFSGNFITGATIPSSVINMDTSVFNDNNFPDATAFIYARNPDGSIDNTIITSYAGLKRVNVSIPNGVITIGMGAFNACELTSVIFPNSILTIEGFAFAFNNLTSINIGSAIERINAQAFMNNRILQGDARIDQIEGEQTVLISSYQTFMNNGSNGTTTITPTFTPAGEPD